MKNTAPNIYKSFHCIKMQCFLEKITRKSTRAYILLYCSLENPCLKINISFKEVTTNLTAFQLNSHPFSDMLSLTMPLWHTLKKILIDNLPSWMKLHSFVKYSLTWKNWTKQYANKLPKNHEIVKIDCCVTFL